MKAGRLLFQLMDRIVYKPDADLVEKVKTDTRK